MVEAVERIHEVPSVLPVLEKSSSPFVQDRSASSIAPAEKKETYVPSKPTLDPVLRTIENYVGRLEPAADRWSRFKEGAIEKKCQEIDALYREEAIKLKEAYEASKTVSFWSILEDIGSSIMSAISFFFGFSAISTGAPVVGGILILSGVLSLGNLAFKYARVWDWVADQVAGKNTTLHSVIKTYIPPAIGITAAGMGIYGSYAAWNYAAQTGIQGVTSILQSTGMIASGLTAFAGGISQGHLREATAQLSFLQSNSELSNLSLEEFLDETKEFHDGQRQIHKTLEEILRETDEAIQVIQQPV